MEEGWGGEATNNAELNTAKEVEQHGGNISTYIFPSACIFGNVFLTVPGNTYIVYGEGMQDKVTIEGVRKFYPGVPEPKIKIEKGANCLMSDIRVKYQVQDM